MLKLLQPGFMEMMLTQWYKTFQEASQAVRLCQLKIGIVIFMCIEMCFHVL